MTEEISELIDKNCVIELLKIIQEHVPEENKMLIENAMNAVNQFSTISIVYHYGWMGDEYEHYGDEW